MVIVFSYLEAMNEAKQQRFVHAAKHTSALYSEFSVVGDFEL